MSRHKAHSSTIFQKAMPWLGLGLIAAYLWLIHPTGFGRAYVGDMCSVEQTRQLMHDAIQVTGHPAFHSARVMAPVGIDAPYLGWALERDWIGAYFWGWNRDFPFLWFYFALSLAATYLGSGYILRKMGLSRASAWGIALVASLIHIPRHFKTWHHYEHLPQHWLYWSLFLDAWIWRDLYRRNRISLTLEAWRGVCLLGTFGLAGYFWGPMILEWVIVRISMAALGLKRARARQVLALYPGRKRLLWPLAAGLALFALDLRWFLPLAHAAHAGGTANVPQVLSYFAPLGDVFRPLWLALVPGLNRIPISPFDGPETVVAAGWLFWVPAIAGLVLIRKKRGGPGWGAVFPHLLFLALGVVYLSFSRFQLEQEVIQAVVPFMEFFRVASRWGLLLPEILAALVVLCWPELSAWARRFVERSPRRAWPALGAFVFLSALEASWLLTPVSTVPVMPADLSSMLAGIRKAPGTTVLDLPFCVAGGNGVCTDAECPFYPASANARCLQGFHDKSVFGIYAGRLVEADCKIYGGQPFSSWFSAWHEQRCFSDGEWKEFCAFLSAHPQLSSVLVYPDLWKAVESPGCSARFREHLGDPIATASMVSDGARGDFSKVPLERVVEFAPRCRQ